MFVIQDLAKQYESEMIAHRRHLHRHPELSGHEKQTTSYIVENLREMGLEPNTSYSQQGCTALIHGDPAGKVIMLRADIDALPIKEESGLPFSSQNDGVMHACGHDFHTSSLLGAARILTQMKDRLKGTVKLCFQPAEEVKGVGACVMVQDGVLEDPKVDLVMGAHVSVYLPVGSVGCEPGPVSAFPDAFSITFQGKGCHGSAPEMGKDPIRAAIAAYHLINDVPSRISSMEPHILQVCTFHAGGGSFNIVPDTATLGGTVRTLTPESRKICKEGIEAACRAVCESYGITYEITGFGQVTPPVVNDVKLAPKVHQSLRKVVPGEIVTETPGKLGGEDFSFFEQTGIPGIFVNYGVSSEDKETHAPLHNAKFCPDEKAIAVGAMVYAQIAIDYLNGEYEE